MKHTHDYDNVFKTMKHRHKRLFISVINETFGKNYPLDSAIEVLPSEGYLTEEETETGDFRDEMMKLYEKNELTSKELIDLIGYVNTIITHITDGNKSEERLVNVMGGTVIESESERLVRIGREGGREEGIKSSVELCQEFGLSVTDAVKKLISKFCLTESESLAKANQYWK